VQSVRTGLRVYRVPTLVGLFRQHQNPTKVGTLNTANETKINPLKNNPPVAFATGNALAVEVFEQWDRVLARDAG
jgi:hypothetical protein